MTISGTVQFSGRLQYAQPVPFLDDSMNPGTIADILEQMACSGYESGYYTLVSDGDTTINFGSLAGIGANVIVVKVMPNIGLPPTPGNPSGTPAVPNPVTAKLTGGAGSGQAISIDPILFLMSQRVTYTALTLARPAGVQVTCRVQLFAFGS